MKFFIAIICAFVTIQATNAASSKKQIHPDVTICKRNDPNLSECFKKNFVTMLPLIKNGYSEMNLIPIDPIIVETIRMDFSQTKSVQLVANLTQVEVRGISEAKTEKVHVKPIPEGLDMYFELFFPRITMVSDYKALGKFLLIGINSVGNFTGDFEDLYLKARWMTTKFMKKNREHLAFTCEIEDMTIKRMKMHFNNLLGNNTELNDGINKSINENIDVLYDEVKPIIIETVKSIALNTVNSVYNLFPYDVLFPVV